MKKVAGKANHNLFKKGDVYWVRYSKDGRTLQKSLATENLTDARYKRDEEIAAFKNSEAPSWKGKKLVEDEFNDWINFQQWRESTKKHVLFQWNKHLKEFFGKMLLSDINSESWERYIAKSREKSADRKLFNDRKYFSMFMHWAKKTDRIDEVPYFKSVDKPPKTGKVYTAEEIKRLILASPPNLKLQIKMAAYMGMRKWEILSLEWSQIDFVKQTIYLPEEKTKIGKARTFAINPDIFEELKSLREKQVEKKIEIKKIIFGESVEDVDKYAAAMNSGLITISPFVFPSPVDPMKSVGKDGNNKVWTSVKRSCKVTGTFHELRHTFLTNAFKSAVNPMVICAYAGLSIEVAQKVYLHLNSDDTKSVANLVKF